MKRSLLLPAAAVICLAACAKKSDAPVSATAAEPVASPPALGKGRAQAPAVAAPMMAYRYSYALQTPAKAVRGLMADHEKACANAGPSVCELVAQESHGEGRDDIGGSITLRATADWMSRFRAGLADQAKGAGGKIVSDQIDSEDLTHSIVDTDAQIRAKIALRDRLQALVTGRPGKLSDLLEVETELARVQGEIDSAQSELAARRGRVAMSELKIRYISAGVWAPEGTWAPVGQAGRESASLTAMAVAMLVRLVAFLGPFAVVLGGGVWVWRRLQPRRKSAVVKPA